MADSQLAKLDTCHDAEASDRSDFLAFLKRGAEGDGEQAEIGGV